MRTLGAVVRQWCVLLLALASASGCSDRGRAASRVDDSAAGSTSGTGGSTTSDVAGHAASSNGGSVSLGNVLGASGANDDPGAAQIIDTLRIEPLDAVLTAKLGQSATQAYRAFAVLHGSQRELDITARTVFYVPDNFLVGGFPLDGSASFSSRVPATATEPAQRGGVVTVQAQAANSDGSTATATTTLTVKLEGTSLPPAGALQSSPPIPASPETQFTGTPSAELAPQIVYPNDGVMLPPNLGQLEVHFKRGSAKNTLFEIQLKGATSDLRFYTRCAADPALFEPGACSFELDRSSYGNIAESNQGAGPVLLVVRGSNEQGAFGESPPFSLEFAENRVDGALYYWNASPPRRIMRVALEPGATPEEFLKPSSFTTDGGQPNQTCVGCHILSRDGSKMAASIGPSSDGRLAYIKDLSVPRSGDWLTVNPASDSGPAKANRILTGSFNPDGSQFVAAAPKNDAADDGTLFFHSGTTGLREGQLPLPFTATAPDWSPDGNKIAVTHIYGSDASSVEFQKGGIDYVEHGANGWSSPVTVVPASDGKNRYNPNFLPGSKYLLYSESRATGSAGDGYADPSAKTWVVAAKLDATPILLKNAGAPSVADAADSSGRGIHDGLLMDTFPRATPFETKHRGGTLMWFTVSSQRRAGLRKVFLNQSAVGDPDTQQLIWMFALDPAALDAGKDGSHPGFFLPYQDMTSSNHMAQWTEKVVSDQPRPPTPTPVPPVPPKPPAIK